MLCVLHKFVCSLQARSLLWVFTSQVQTFLPYPDYGASAQCLDWQRLGKQRSECLQILRAIYVPTYGWQHHPAVHMWRGHAWQLAEYALVICDEWARRGYRDFGTRAELACFNLRPGSPAPPWLGDPALHASHRSNLLRKNPTHYRQFGWSEPDNLPYIWHTSC